MKEIIEKQEEIIEGCFNCKHQAGVGWCSCQERIHPEDQDGITFSEERAGSQIEKEICEHWQK